MSKPVASVERQLSFVESPIGTTVKGAQCHGEPPSAWFTTVVSCLLSTTLHYLMGKRDWGDTHLLRLPASTSPSTVPARVPSAPSVTKSQLLWISSHRSFLPPVLLVLSTPSKIRSVHQHMSPSGGGHLQTVGLCHSDDEQDELTML